MFDFAEACAEYLTSHDGAAYVETYQNAMENPDDLYNYLWWLGGNARNICVEYSWVLDTEQARLNRANS